MDFLNVFRTKNTKIIILKRFMLTLIDQPIGVYGFMAIKPPKQPNKSEANVC